MAGRNPSQPLGGRRRGEPESDNSWWIVEITEGRTRQIREMFFQIGHPVQKLRRVAIGPLRDPELPVGALRELSEQEVRKLLRSARGPEERSQEKRPAPRKAAPKASPKKTAPKKAARPKPASEKPARPAAKKRSAPSKRAGAKKVTPVRKAARKPKARR
jgi:23S rRNA pseudouridine2605 synthase